ncbi:MAG: YceD family protein [Solidesulfovibrio sp. DCME]|uniref:YceD family protein n=1 Tax=Solidesulfovibrio sp. DCME TaxID=3447380 RepID=UPI003D125A89
MSELWLDITDLPAEGREFSFSDQALWTGPIAEFALPHVLTAPGTGLAATFSVLPQTRGALVRGKLAGTVVVPCDRCAEDVRLTLDEDFELFEEAPLEGEEALEPGLLRRRGKVLELDVGSLLWEQYLLALPVKPLCDENCRGLCPRCGAPLREGPCGCAEADGDPRLAVLKNLKVPRGSN